MVRHRGFTLIELLVVITVISVLAAILFPVFSAAKASAIKANCLSRFHGVSEATQLYLGDYDESFMPVNQDPGAEPNARTDRTWVQLLLPYIGNSLQTFRCPADGEGLAETDAIFDQDLLPGDLFSRYYTASMHVNVGYNFQYLAPIVKDGDAWESQPKTMVALANPASMLMFVDSVWEVKDGEPVGGGSYLVSPPCRFQTTALGSFDTIALSMVGSRGTNHATQIFAPLAGWQPLSPSGPTYGGAWPWHTGKATVASVDGSVRSMSMDQLGAGCEIRPKWKGTITDRRTYLWSPE